MGIMSLPLFLLSFIIFSVMQCPTQALKQASIILYLSQFSKWLTTHLNMLYRTCWYKIKYLYKKYIFGLLEHILLMKSAEFIHELITEMTLE